MAERDDRRDIYQDMTKAELVEVLMAREDAKSDGPLEQQTKLLTMTLESMDQGIMLIDPNDYVVLSNQKAARLLQIPEAVLEGQPHFSDVIRHQVETTTVLDEMRERMVLEQDPTDPGIRDDGDKDPGDSDYWRTLLRGGVRSYRRDREDGIVLEFRNLRLNSGWVVRTITDVTTEHEVTRRQQESERLLRETLDNIDAKVLVYDADDRYLLGSRNVQDTLPPHEDLVGKTFEEFLWMEIESGRVSDPLALSDPGAYVAERVKQRREAPPTRTYQDSTGRWILTRRHRTQDGKTIVLLVDITERKRAEEALAEKEAQIRMILDNVPAGIRCVNKDRNYVFFNSQYVALRGLPEGLIKPGDSVLVSHTFSADRGDFGEGDAEELAANALTALPFEIEPQHYERTTALGRVLECHSQPLAQGGYVSIYADVTDRRRAEQELAEKEAQLRLVLDNVPAGVRYVDKDRRYVLFNSKYHEIYNVPADLVKVGDSVWAEHLYLAERGDYGQGDPKALATAHMNARAYFSEPLHYESTTTEGRVVEVQTQPVSSGGFVSIYNEITERRLMEDALSHQTAMLRSTLDTMVQGLVVTDDAGRIVLFNQNVCDLLDLPNEFLATQPDGLELWDFQDARGEFDDINPEERKRFRNAVNSGAYGAVGVVERRRPNGRYFSMQTSQLPDGGFVRTYTDVTERREFETELESQRQLLKNSLDNMEQGILVMDKDDRIVLYNNRVCQLLEMPGSYFDTLPTNSEFWQHQADTGEFTTLTPEQRAELDRRANTEQRREIDGYERMRPDGTHLWIIINALPNGGLVETYTDITDRKLAEVELAEAKQLAEESNRAKSAFLASMSHEIRTPLSGISGFLELLQYSKLDEDQREMVRSANLSSRYLIDLIGDVLDFSKIEAGHLDLRVERVSPRKLLDEAVSVVAPLAQEKLVDLFGQMSPRVPDHMELDPVRVRQILVNLLGNAVKFSASGSVHIDISPAWNQTSQEWRLRFEVTDTGIGFDPAVTPDLFGEFRQADETTTRRFGGTGLGLAISKRLVEMMRGEIGYEAEAGRGAMFWFALPLREPRSVSTELMKDLDLSVLVFGRDDESGKKISALVAGSGCGVEIRDHATVGDVERFDAIVSIDGSSIPSAEAVRRLSDTRIFLTTAKTFQSKNQALRAGFTHILPEDRWADSLIHHISESKILVAPSASNEFSDEVAGTFAEKLRSDLAGLPILVIDDIEMNRRIAGRQLDKFKLSHEFATNGEEGLTKVVANTYAAVIVDVSMPVMDGYEFTKAFRRWEENNLGKGVQRTTIIALTANVTADDAEKCVAAGMDDYMSKPLTMARLSAMLLKWLGTDESEPNLQGISDGPANAPAIAIKSDPSPIDFVDLAEILGTDDRQELLAFIRESLTHVSDIMVTLDQAFIARDRTTMRTSAHSACGSAKYVSATRLAKTYFNIERNAASASWDELSSLIESTKTQVVNIEALVGQLELRS